MKQSSSSEQLDGDGDSASDGSSENNYSFEFAQMEVTMKTLGNNGGNRVLICLLKSSC